MRRPTALLALALACALAAPAQAVVAVRKDVKDMTASEKRDFVRAVLKLKHTRSPFGKHHISYYDVFVYYHRRVSNLKIDGAHQGPAFLPWHREFLYAFEAALENINHDKHLAIPYWDWTDPASTRAVFGRDFMGGDGVAAEHHAVMDGPFRRGRWHVVVNELVDGKNPFEPDIDQVSDHDYLQRSFGNAEEVGVDTLPDAQEMSAVLGAPKYDVAPWNRRSDPALSFRCALEGWSTPGVPVRRGSHNRVHLWVGGIWPERGGEQIGTIGGAASPNDPVFWLIHSNIDRLWQRWEKEHGQVYAPEHGAAFGHNLRDPLSQFAQLGLTVTGTGAKKLRPVDLLDPAPLQAVYEDPQPDS